MELFDRIYNDRELFSIVGGSCSENNMYVRLSECLFENNEINSRRVVILKPDSYYATYNKTLADYGKPPPAADCLVIVRCDDCVYYDLYVIELRDVYSGTSGIKYKEIAPKFETVLNRFFNEFDHVFSDIEFRQVKLILVTNPYKAKNEYSHKERFANTAMDAYSGQRLSFRNKQYPIQPVYPNKTHIYPC